MIKPLIIALCVVLSSCSTSAQDIERQLREISKSKDPRTLVLEQGFNSYIQRTFLEDHTEVGIIRLKDGSYAKYWFRSHHITDGSSGTLFQLSDGSEIFMEGYFCCEVQLTEKQMYSLQDLRTFIKKYDGVAP